MRLRLRVRASFAADVDAQVARLRARGDHDRIDGLRAGIREAKRLLARFPAAGTRLDDRPDATLRRLVLRKLPFVVWYVVTEDELSLVRLFHARQHRPLGRARR